MNAKKESKKKRKLENGAADEAAAEAAAAKPAKKKKSKEAAAAAGEQPPKKKSKKDKSAKDANKKAESDDEPAAAPATPAPDALDNFPLAEGIKSLLRSKGIEALFPIQTACFNLVVGGTDVVGRARTGCGKTLAFVLPIVQSLANNQQKASGGRHGRLPSVIVLAPTRELAKQVRHCTGVYACEDMTGVTCCVVVPQQQQCSKAALVVVQLVKQWHILTEAGYQQQLFVTLAAAK